MDSTEENQQNVSESTWTSHSFTESQGITIQPFNGLTLRHFFWHDIGRTIITGQHRVCFAIANEFLRLRIHLERHTDNEFVLLNINAVGFQMSSHTLVSFQSAFVSFDRFANLCW